MNTIALDPFADIVDERDVPTKYLSIFIDETELALDSLAETLLNLEESAGGSASDVESLLILSHRIKGSAASVGLNRPAKLAHFMEDVLQELRESGSGVAAKLTDPFLDCIDSLRVYVTGLRNGDPDSSGFNTCASELLQTYSGAGESPSDDSNSSDDSSNEPVSQQGPEQEPGAAVAEIRTIDDAFLSEMQDFASECTPTIVGKVWFETDLPLAGLKGRLLLDKLQRLGEVRHTDPASDEIQEFDDLESMEFVVVSEAGEQAVRQALVVAGVNEIQLKTLNNNLKPEKGEGEPSSPPPHEEPTVIAAGEASKQAGETAKKQKLASPPKGPSNKPAETLRVDIERLDQLVNLAGQLVINKARFHELSEGLREALPAKQSPQLVANVESLADKMVNAIEQQSGNTAHLELDVIRSHARRMQTDLATVSKEINRLAALRSGINGLLEAVHQLDRVTDGIQKSVMETRMVSIGPLFGRFKRVIRDITRSNDKKIRLEICGENTELDKRMIDELGDPLIHMVRNSADHGVETPADRRSQGKPEEGVITLDAHHQGNSVVIQVSDDGQGLDEAKILKRAIEKGIVSPNDAERLTQHQIHQFIWDPGFTTAEKVTQISGRGMGMDIVRSKIEQLNGLVEVSSEKGKGSTFTIKLPLTMAILPSLMATIEGDVFALPIEAIQEIVNFPSEELHRVHGQTAATIRGRIISVVKLSDLFSWRQPSQRTEELSDAECTLVVLSIDGKEIGLVVDNLLGEQDIVIKSMAKNFQDIPGIAGASILGNGSVSLILDIAALIEMSAGIAHAKNTLETAAIQE